MALNPEPTPTATIEETGVVLATRPIGVVEVTPNDEEHDKALLRAWIVATYPPKLVNMVFSRILNQAALGRTRLFHFPWEDR